MKVVDLRKIHGIGSRIVKFGVVWYELWALQISAVLLNFLSLFELLIL